jgi:K+-sensing histidine kinase KdpD
MQPRDGTVRMHDVGPTKSDPARRLPTTPTSRSPLASPAGPVATRDREAFLDILTHELRTPVTTIYGGAQLLATRDLQPTRRRAVAADVWLEADRLYRLVEDLVVLLRSERTGLRPVGEPVAIGHLVELGVTQLLTRHPEVRVRLLGTRDAAADGADEVLVMHVLRNLLDNAVRYGGATDPIEVVVTGSATEVMVRIVHRGGAPGHDGDPFALTPEAHGTDAGRAGGGIGLYVADRLVQAMHGRMWTRPSGTDHVEFGFTLSRSGASRADT